MTLLMTRSFPCPHCHGLGLHGSRHCRRDQVLASPIDATVLPIQKHSGGDVKGQPSIDLFISRWSQGGALSGAGGGDDGDLRCVGAGWTIL